MRWGRVVGATMVVAGLALPSAAGALPGINIQTARETDPIVLKGAALGRWSVPSNLTLKLPLSDIFGCPLFETDNCAHNDYVNPDLDTAPFQKKGIPINRFLGYRWNGKESRYDQIPFQIDERFARYLDNAASGFAIYSGDDQHTTYAFDGPGDREGFRYTVGGPATDPCHARTNSPNAHDPISGLDANDEIAFMASDAGPAAPKNAQLPKGILASKRFSIVDPLRDKAVLGYVYIMRRDPEGPAAKFTARNGYVRYKRDKNADQFAFSESSYDNYGNAAKGIYCDPKTGKVVMDPKTGKPAIERRRPLDNATVKTARYTFDYDGRWLMGQVKISPDGGKTYDRTGARRASP